LNTLGETNYIGDITLEDPPNQDIANGIAIGFSFGVVKGNAEVKSKFRDLFYEILDFRH
jgi:hypothetical protein